MNRYQVPAVGKIMNHHKLTPYREKLEHEFFKSVIRSELHKLKTGEGMNLDLIDESVVINVLVSRFEAVLSPTIKRVINATGVILHTNLGRAPWGEYLTDSTFQVAKGYSNIELDLLTGKRSNRNFHLKEIVSLYTGGEDSIAVNNNAAALFLMISALAKGKNVLVSRGELVEIGGSFRIPDIIKSSGANLIEVGTTNKTKLSDYANAITEETAMILKVHKSNYYMHGFTAEVSAPELVSLAKDNNLIFCHDLGTGLPKRELLSGVKRFDDGGGRV